VSLSPTEIGTPDHAARCLVPTLNAVNSIVTLSEKKKHTYIYIYIYIYGRRERAAKLWKIYVTGADVVVKVKGQLH